jgi:phosphoribosyl 1,2-cyclic phosphate phosphodiesterase
VIKNKINFLGTGTSSGIPQLGCSCFVCTSSLVENKRQRTSIFLETKKGKKILVDAGHDVRNQLLQNKITFLDGLIITHHHVDHCLAIEELKYFFFRQENPIELACTEETYVEMKTMFPFFFSKVDSKLKITFITQGQYNFLDEQFYFHVLPHDRHIQTLSFYHEKLVYLIDFSTMDQEYQKFLQQQDISIFIIEMLRKHPRSTHHCYYDVLKLMKKFSYQEAYCVHLSHLLEHEGLTEELKKTKMAIKPAYDGLKKEY